MTGAAFAICRRRSAASCRPGTLAAWPLALRPQASVAAEPRALPQPEAAAPGAEAEARAAPPAEAVGSGARPAAAEAAAGSPAVAMAVGDSPGVVARVVYAWRSPAVAGLAQPSPVRQAA